MVSVGAKQEIIQIKPIEVKTATITVEGTSPLLVHNWGIKAKRQMLEKQMKTSKTKGREAKDPFDDFIHSLYWLTDEPESATPDEFAALINGGATFGFPATGFKQATLSGAYQAGVTPNKTGLRSSFFIEGEGAGQLVKINGTPEPHESMVRIGGISKTADIRYRGVFNEWSAALTFRYNAGGQFTLEQIVNCISLGGFSIGVGEWRPERDGSFGTYRVVG